MKKTLSYYFEWWQIKNSTVLVFVALVLLLVLTAGGIWWLINNKDNILRGEQGEIPKDAAVLISFEGEVRILRAATRETVVVTTQTYVSAGDTVQTQGNSKARIRMIDGSILTVRPDSTVVIRDSSSIFGATRVGVRLNDGQINVRTQEQPDGTENIVEMRKSENQLYPQTDASFNLNDQSEGGEIRVSRGTITSTIGETKETLSENEFASLGTEKIATREKILAPPKLISPAQNTQIPTSSTGSDVGFNWERSESASNQIFQIQISRSPFFLSDALVLMRESLETTNLLITNMTPGNYYWRVRAKNASGQISDWSESSRYTIVRARSNVIITLTDLKTENVGGNLYIIKGKTKPGAIVRVLGREMFSVGDGSFQLQVASNSPEITVEISDEQGNRNRFLISLKKSAIIRQL